MTLHGPGETVKLQQRAKPAAVRELGSPARRKVRPLGMRVVSSTPQARHTQQDSIPTPRDTAQTLEVRAQAEKPATRMEALPRNYLATAGDVVLRAGRLSLDAMLIVLFSPVILVWLLMERRRRNSRT